MARLIEWFKSLFKPRPAFDPTVRFISESGSFPVPWRFIVWGPASSENRNASISPNMTSSRFLWCVREAASRYPEAIEIIRERLEDDLGTASWRLSVVRAFCEVADEVKKLRLVEAEVQYGRLMPGEEVQARHNMYFEVMRMLHSIEVPAAHRNYDSTSLLGDDGPMTEELVECFSKGGISPDQVADKYARSLDKDVLLYLLGTLKNTVSDLTAKRELLLSAGIKSLTKQEGEMP